MARLLFLPLEPPARLLLPRQAADSVTSSVEERYFARPLNCLLSKVLGDREWRGFAAAVPAAAQAQMLDLLLRGGAEPPREAKYGHEWTQSTFRPLAWRPLENADAGDKFVHVARSVARLLRDRRAPWEQSVEHLNEARATACLDAAEGGASPPLLCCAECPKSLLRSEAAAPAGSVLPPPPCSPPQALRWWVEAAGLSRMRPRDNVGMYHAGAVDSLTVVRLLVMAGACACMRNRSPPADARSGRGVPAGGEGSRARQPCRALEGRQRAWESLCCLTSARPPRPPTPPSSRWNQGRTLASPRPSGLISAPPTPLSPRPSPRPAAA